MGRIITFYSFKGGVGRTFALANVAVLLAKRGKRVLLMDWDLEAPGLHRYFKQHLSRDLLSKGGVIHLLHEALNNPNIGWESVTTEFNIENDLPISIIPSGDQTADYVEKVRTFSWTDFFENRQGGAVLERWRTEWKKQFDFILLDSRTGITDTGGVCTIFMPDILVLVFSTNEQSFESGVQIVRGVQDSRRTLAVPRPPAAILPLLGRFDGRDEVDESRQWLDRFGRELKPFYDDWLPKKFAPRQILELTKVPYITKFTYGEPLPVITHGITDPEFPGFYLENVTRLLASDFRDAQQIIAPEDIGGKPGVAEFRSRLAEVPIDEEAIRQVLTVIEHELGDKALTDLLNEAGLALMRQGNLESAENYFRKALAISETQLGSDATAVVSSLTHLAELLFSTERLSEAEELYRRALAVLDDAPQTNAPTITTTYNNLALLLRETGRISEAEELYHQAIERVESSGRLEDPSVTITYNNLASLMRQAGRLHEAEDLYRKALRLQKEYSRPGERGLITTYNNLARVLRESGRSSEAEAVYREALFKLEKYSRPDDPALATTYNNLAKVLRESGRYSDAEAIYREALSKLDDHSRLGDIHNSLAGFLRERGRYLEAEDTYREALSKLESHSRSDNPIIANTYNNLAGLLIMTGRPYEAEAVYREALSKLETNLRPGSLGLTTLYNNLAKLLHKLGQSSEAERLYQQTLAMLLRSARPNDRGLITTYRNFARMLFQDRKLAEAEAMYGYLITILNKTSSGRSNELGTALNELGEVLMAKNEPNQAERMFRRALSITDPQSYPGRRAMHNLALLPEGNAKRTEIPVGIDPKSFDTFIIHNGSDKKFVRQLALGLRAAGIRVWLDEWELIPGTSWVKALEEVINSVASIVVCIGPSGSPWSLPEVESLITDALTSERLVIPVLLPGTLEDLEIHPHLRFLIAVDFREGITNERISRLVRGITGGTPDNMK